MQGMKSRSVVKWREGEGRVWEHNAALCIPAARLGLAQTRQALVSSLPSNGLTVAQTAWQPSKALPLNHIKVSLALH